MKKIILPITLLCMSSVSFAQQKNISGTVVDTSAGTKVSNVSISVLTAKDSLLYDFSHSDPSGKFSIKIPTKESYFLLFEYPLYADYISPVMEPGKDPSLGNIPMISKTQALQEVIIKSQRKSMYIKGDTTVFVADSFKVQPNATVEDLLRRLPGVQVDNKGNITAQGKTVQKVLVDGEEFFGDDPKLVTQNLRADIVDKVQIFDKKSDQAAFTGVDDGNEKTTINLQVKEGAKKGTFGKVEAGAGTNGFHQSTGNFNQFKNKQKFSAIAEIANTAQAGLNWTDRDFGSNDDENNSDGADITTTQSSSSKLISWDGNYNSQGIPLSQLGGLHYNNSWNNDRANLSADYKINRLHINGNSESDVINNLASGTQTSVTKTQMSDLSMRNKMDGKSTLFLDSAKTTSLIINAHGELNHKNSSRQITGSTIDEDGNKINDNTRTTSNIGDNNGQHLDLLFRKKLKKDRRTISLFVSEQSTTDQGNGFLHAAQNYYKIDSSSVTDQQKNYNSDNFVLQTKATYTEPLSQHASLIANYGFILNNANSRNYSFNKNAAGDYSDLDSTYSNRYKFNQFMHRAGLFYSYNTTKTLFNIGTNVGFNHYTQHNQFSNTDFVRNFINWYPRARYRHTGGGNRTYSIEYNGSTAQPSVTQIQPLLNNQDPLNIYIGNPDLKPAYTNTVRFRMNRFDMLNQSGVFLGVVGTNTLNNITSNTETDVNTGKTNYKYVNINGTGSVSAYAYYYKKISDFSMNPGFEATMGRSKNLVNGVANLTNTKTLTMRNNFNLDKDKAYHLGLWMTVGYNWNQSTLQKEMPNNYFSTLLDPSTLVYLPGNLKVNVEYEYHFQGKSKAYNSTNSYGLLNAYIGKTFFKNEALELRITGHDLLNQNQNFSRQNYGNQFYQSFSNVVKRYMMFSLIWNFHTGMASGMKNDDND